jgi:hypothetical protein
MQAEQLRRRQPIEKALIKRINDPALHTDEARLVTASLGPPNAPLPNNPIQHLEPEPPAGACRPLIDKYSAIELPVSQ